MLIDWLKLIPALVLLLVPIGVFHNERVHYRALMRDWHGYWRRTLFLEFHTLDLVRAVLGAWLLIEALKAEPGASRLMHYAPLMLRTVILTLATALQALFCKEEEAANAPFAFVAGLVLGIMPPLVSGFALVASIALASGAGFPTVFFPLVALFAPGIGALFLGKKLGYDVISLAVAALTPWMITLMFPRHFVCSYRAGPKAAPAPPPR
jgi:ABC-type uncharacterized transport system permease subunit